MKENRKPNTNCDYCNKAIYRRPFQIETCKNNYCSRQCRGLDSKNKGVCPVCDSEFHPRSKQIYCSRQCSGKTTRNRLGKRSGEKTYKNYTEKNMLTLKKAFDFNSCMVKGCSYNICYDIHRLKEGKDGGKYEIGNMFAICPNHHSEIHRGITIVKKINDYTLEIVN
jgi:hypothetical protein